MLRKVSVALAFGVSVLLAQEAPQMPTAPDPAAPARVGVGITQRQLGLEEAIQLALENNLDIDIERTNRSTAETNVVAARGLFDPSFRWTPLLETRNTPAGSVLQGSGGKLTDKGFVNNFYLRQRLPNNWGSVAHLDFENSRTTSTNPFQSFNPILSSRLVVGFTQPILRGRTIDRERAELRISQKQVNAANIDLESRIIEVVGRVEQAYWDLVAARQAVAVSGDSVGWAREQVAINQRLINAGTLAPIELAAAEAELQRRVDTWYTNLGALTEVENGLKSLIAPERVASIWNDEIIPTDIRTAAPPDADDLRTAVQVAIKQRPELRSLGVRREINDVQKQLNADLQKPEVNFIGQYWLSGLGGTANSTLNPFTEASAAQIQRLNDLSVRLGLQPLPTGSLGGGPPEFLVGNYGTALGNLFGGRYQSFQMGLSIDFNFRNRAANANYSQTLISEKRLGLEKARAEQVIEAQVRNAMQGIQTARQRIAAAEASARAAKEKLDSEQRLYQTGESTNFLVLTRQNEYADSRRREVVARLDFNKSVSRLEQALGTTLSTYRIAIH
jgi:HAE1 family hydrophobic/amphiphilic exporter-1